MAFSELLLGRRMGAEEEISLSHGESHYFPVRSKCAKLGFCKIHSLITIVFFIAWPKAKLTDVIAVGEKNALV